MGDGGGVKFLLDQNLSYRLVSDLERAFPGSRHVKDFGLARSDDEAIWNLAAEQGFAIVSKDSDFTYRALVRGHPPKCIHLCVGNCPTSRIRNLLLDHAELIEEFLADSVEALLNLE